MLRTRQEMENLYEEIVERVDSMTPEEFVSTFVESEMNIIERCLKKTNTPDYMFEAWCDCMSWAIGEKVIRKQFELDTDMHYKLPNSPLDKMIDEATGYEKDYIEKFIIWANENIWGNVESCK